MEIRSLPPAPISDLERTALQENGQVLIGGRVELGQIIAALNDLGIEASDVELQVSSDGLIRLVVS
jgi:hypothetical protein